MIVKPNSVGDFLGGEWRDVDAFGLPAALLGEVHQDAGAGADVEQASGAAGRVLETLEMAAHLANDRILGEVAVAVGEEGADLGEVTRVGVALRLDRLLLVDRRQRVGADEPAACAAQHPPPPHVVDEIVVRAPAERAGLGGRHGGKSRVIGGIAGDCNAAARIAPARQRVSDDRTPPSRARPDGSPRPPRNLRAPIVRVSAATSPTRRRTSAPRCAKAKCITAVGR